MTAPWWTSQNDSLAPQELRIAASFSGGVSLAIWMGGLTYELDRLLRSSDAERAWRLQDRAVQPGDARYAALLSLLKVDVDVDVITGTSAGGINGAALALARATGSSLAPMRSVWLERGSFTTLMRTVDDEKPPSLLRGDDVLLAGLHEGLEAIRSSGSVVPGDGRRTAADADAAPGASRRNRLRLLITSTMTTPDVTTVRDSLGTPVYLEDNQALFRFDQPPGSGVDQGEFDVTALARAARSSASYPGAFEPSFVRVNDPTGVGPDLRKHLSIQSSRWMIDGGLRNNQPVGPALRSVWEQPAGRGARRVLLHIVPNPGTPNPPPARQDSTPTLLASLGATMAAPFIQSWRADLEAARVQSLDAARRAEGSATVLDLATVHPQAWPALAGALRDVRSTWVADTFVTALDMQLSRFATAGQGPTAGRTGSGTRTYASVRAKARTMAAQHWANGTDDLAPVSLAHYGADLYNATLGVLLRRLRDAEGTAGWQTTELTTFIARAAEGLHESRESGDSQVLFERDLLATFLREQLRDWRPGSEEDLTSWALAVFRRWLNAAFPLPTTPSDDGADSAARLRQSWQTLEAWSTEQSQILAQLPEPGVLDISLAGALMRGASELLTSGDRRLTDQEIALVQLSARSRTLLDPTRRAPEDKLLGVGMAHFGAFVRRSWRANDWMWGRLDGVGWAVHMVLTPSRLLQAAAAMTPEAGRRAQVDALVAALRTIACSDQDGRADPSLEKFWDSAVGRAQDEIDSLVTSPDEVESLPWLSMLVAYGIQRDAAAEELPVVADAMQRRESGAATAPRDTDRAFVELVRARMEPGGARMSPEAVPEALTTYRVWSDTGTADLMVNSELRSTAFDALAVGFGALDASTPMGAPVLPQATATARTASRGLARAVRTNALSGMASAGLVVVGVILMLLGTPALSALGFPMVVGGVVALVVTGVADPTWRSRVLAWTVPVGVVASLVVAWLVARDLDAEDLQPITADSVRPVLFTLVALLGIAVSVLAWWLIRGVTRLGSARRETAPAERDRQRTKR